LIKTVILRDFKKGFFCIKMANRNFDQKMNDFLSEKKRVFWANRFFFGMQ